MKKEETRSVEETQGIWRELLRYPQVKHDSLLTRPQPLYASGWSVPVPGEQLSWFCQGIPGIWPGSAKNLAKVFPTPDSLMDRSMDKLLSVNLIGKPRALAIDTFMREVRK